MIDGGEERAGGDGRVAGGVGVSDAVEGVFGFEENMLCRCLCCHHEMRGGTRQDQSELNITPH